MELNYLLSVSKNRVVLFFLLLVTLTINAQTSKTSIQNDTKFIVNSDFETGNFFVDSNEYIYCR